ncbi:DUF6687 family protein [Schlesneria paludicola]|uniref:DUF6687 family protein n=1 Tax=Schlesneria paludicola TaxID=360056 RepID=UPI0012FC2A94|nr:DUF6687 family protein [Schlesneria paludicola]
MIDRFEILGAGAVRPNVERVLFCDGTDGRIFRPESDLELSHWRPNRTPSPFRAGTSTEICFRFLDQPSPGNWTVAVNNHVDVDGMLSVYTLVHSRHALQHRETIIGAAEMGDFWGYGDLASQRVFQGLTRIMTSDAEGRAVYDEAFARLPRLIDGTDREIVDIDRSLEPLRRGAELVESGQIRRTELDPRLSHYVIPLGIAGDDDDVVSFVPDFNELISGKCVLWPHVRAQWDCQRVCVVSAERKSGWFHDIWFPGYLWADTENRWIPPGAHNHDGMRSYDIANPMLVAAIEQLQRLENAEGLWGVGGTSLPFGEALQARFPLVGRFLDDQGRAAASRLVPEQIAAALAGVFCLECESPHGVGVI